MKQLTLKKIEKLESRRRPEQIRKAHEELAAIMEQLQAEYNAPEAVAQRKAEYEELQRIGELRRQDFYCGRNMDECHPLPWQ